MAKPNSQAVAVARPTSLVTRIAERYHVDPDKLLLTLKSTVFRGAKDKQTGHFREATNEELMALLAVADQYRLNPFTKEIYAFPDEKRGGIVPVVSVDGWIRIINERPELRSTEFGYAEEGSDDQWISCTIKRADRDAPVEVREYLAECRRDTGPWQSHPRRMLRHKALIQCARIAFGFGGIYDPDEAERIVEATATLVPVGKPATKAPQAMLGAPQEYTSVPLEELQKELDASGMPESEFFGHFEIGALEELPLSQVPAAFEKIRSVHAG